MVAFEVLFRFFKSLLSQPTESPVKNFAVRADFWVWLKEFRADRGPQEFRSTFPFRASHVEIRFAPVERLVVPLAFSDPGGLKKRRSPRCGGVPLETTFLFLG